MHIEIEGIDGSGKTTQCNTLVSKLKSSGRRASIVKDLSQATLFGSSISQVIMSDILRDPRAELFSFLACKAQLYGEVIKSRIENSEWIVADRGGASFLTYNLLRVNISALELQSLLNIATFGLRPKVTFLLDIPVELAIARKRKQRAVPTRFDNMDPDFFRSQRQAFLDLAQKDPGWVVINGEESESFISNIIWDRCQPYF